MPLVRGKWLRRAAKVGGGLVIGLAGMVLYLRLFGGTVNQRVSSPDGRVVAQVRTFDFSALDPYYTYVEVSARYNPLRHIVLGGPNYGAEIKLSWMDANNLIVTCVNCDQLSGYESGDRRWDGVTIHYQYLSSRKYIEEYLRDLREHHQQ